MSNNCSLSLLITSNSKEQRKRIFKEIENKRLPHYHCRRDGDYGVYFCMDVRDINNAVDELVELPIKYPNSSVDATLFDSMNGLYFHRIYNTESWEEVWTIEDAIDKMTYRMDEFSPEMLERKTFRKVYDWKNSLLSEEHKMVPFPVEEMPDCLREGYERWKENPAKWEREKEKEKKNREYRETHKNDKDDLPF